MEELQAFKETKDSNGYDHQFSSETNDDVFEKDKKHISERGQWGGRFEFLLAIVGYTVGTGSIWRFPIICAKNGGGAFLIPFVFFLVTCGGPLYYLEVCLGQFSGKSAVLAFELCPLFKGENIFVCLSACMYVYQSVSLSVFLSISICLSTCICLSVSLLILSFCLSPSRCLFVSPSLSLSLSLSLCGCAGWLGLHCPHTPDDMSFFFLHGTAHIFHFFTEDICCEYSLEAPLKGSSNEYT